jgi:hypothetical protein
MNFCTLRLRNWVLASFAFIHVAKAQGVVSFESTTDLETTRVITLASLLGLIFLPIVLGLIYSKYLLGRLHRRYTATVTESTDDPGLSEVSEMMSRKPPGSFLSRIMDMRTNAVLRLWWRRQYKVHGVSLENDVESQNPTRASSVFPAASASTVVSPSKKVKKEKKSKSTVVDETLPKEKKAKKKKEDPSYLSPK